MARASRISVFCLLLIVGTEALKLPEYIKPCSRNDPHFNDCALKNGREAIPRLVRGDRKLGVPVLDPLFVERASITHAGIQLTAINVTLVGVKDVELEAFSVDFERQVIKLSLKAPRATLTGWYDVKGSILGLPLNGQGECHIFVDGPHGNYSTNYTLTQSADGEQYMVPVAYDVEIGMDRLMVNFGNLFNGNKLLGDTMNNFINENWHVVLEDIGKPLVKSLGGIVHQIISNVLQKVPYNELFTK